MRCHICDSLLSSPTWNSLHEDYDPCPTCLEMIMHVFEDPPEQFELDLDAEEESLSDDVLATEDSGEGFEDSNRQNECYLSLGT